MVPVERAAAGTGSVLNSIGADVKYLACRDICIPEKAHKTLTFPAANVTPNPEPERRSLFEQTRKQLPKPLPAGWYASVTQRNDLFLLSIRADAQIRGATFFPLEAGEIENSAPQAFNTSETGFSLTLRMSDQLARPISTLKGILVLDSGRTFELATPVISRR